MNQKLRAAIIAALTAVTAYYLDQRDTKKNEALIYEIKILEEKHKSSQKELDHIRSKLDKLYEFMLNRKR